jgi:hypothetical protein
LWGVLFQFGFFSTSRPQRFSWRRLVHDRLARAPRRPSGATPPPP